MIQAGEARLHGMLCGLESVMTFGSGCAENRQDESQGLPNMSFRTL